MPINQDSGKRIVATIISLMVLTSCSLLENDSGEEGTERTYPAAFDFEFSTIYKMKTEIEPPDSLNVNAYVTAVIKCPADAQCILPDGIIISDSLDAESFKSRIHLTVERPLQFTEDRRYRMSLDLSTWPGNGEKRFKMLGYSVFNNEN